MSFEVDGSQNVVVVEKHNMLQKGKIHITKSGEIFSTVLVEENKGFSDRYTPVYETCGLKGAVCEIRAAEDIYTPDGIPEQKRVRWLIPLQRMTVGKHPVPFLYLGKYEISKPSHRLEWF